MATIDTHDYLFLASCGNIRLLEHPRFPKLYVLVTHVAGKELAEVTTLGDAIPRMSFEGDTIELGGGDSIVQVEKGWKTITGLIYSEHTFYSAYDAYKFYRKLGEIVLTINDKSYVCDRPHIPSFVENLTAEAGKKITIEFLKGE